MDNAEVTAGQKLFRIDPARFRIAVEAARRQLGSRGVDNPQMRAATAELERAGLDLEKITVRAPADGLINDLSCPSANSYRPGRRARCSAWPG